MKTLIACIRQWFCRFCNRFSTYELCQPEEKAVDQLSHKKVVGNEAAVSARAPIHRSEAVDMTNKRRGRSGLDGFIAKLRRDIQRKRRESYESKKRHYYRYRQ